MARTQLHSAASGPARTAFHAHRGVGVEELQAELAQTETALTARIDTAETGLTARIDTAETGLTARIDTAETGLTARIDTAETDLTAIIGTTEEVIEGKIEAARQSIKQDTRHIPRDLGPVISRAALTSEQQQQAFRCLLALNRAESLAIDTSRGAAQNNRTLRQIRNDRLVRSGLKTLPDMFQESVQAMHNNFPISPENEAQERLERFWMIQDLRRAIMAHFAAPPPAVPSSTTAADAPATQDTQS